MFPCNRSFQAPIHFHLRHLIGTVTSPGDIMSLHRVWNVAVDWRGLTPARLEMSRGWPRRDYVHLNLGVCTAHSPTEATEAQGSVTAWVRGRLDPRTGNSSSLTSDENSHNCARDHVEKIGSKYSKACLVKTGNVKGLGHEADFAHCIVIELSFAQNPWSAMTLLLNDITAHESKVICTTYHSPLRNR